MCVGGVCVCMPALTPRPSSPIDASCTALPRRPAATLGPRDAAGPCCSACRALWCGACRGAGRAACWRGVGGQGAALHRRLLVSGRGGCSMRRCPPGLPACARGIGSPAPCSLFWGALLGAGGMGGGPARLWGQGWLPTGGHRGWHRHPHPTAVETDIPPPLAAAFCRDMLEQAPAAMGQMVAAAALSARLPFRQVSAPGPPRARPPPCAPCPPPAACPLARAAVPPPGQRVRYLWPGCLPLPPTPLVAFQFTTAAYPPPPPPDRPAPCRSSLPVSAPTQLPSSCWTPPTPPSHQTSWSCCWSRRVTRPVTPRVTRPVTPLPAAAAGAAVPAEPAAWTGGGRSTPKRLPWWPGTGRRWG